MIEIVSDPSAAQEVAVGDRDGDVTGPLPVLPLRDIVVFPHMIVPLFVGREKSFKALEEVMRSDTFILLATQKNASDDDPATDAIFEVGTLASVLQLLKLPTLITAKVFHLLLHPLSLRLTILLPPLSSLDILPQSRDRSFMLSHSSNNR